LSTAKLATKQTRTTKEPGSFEETCNGEEETTRFIPFLKKTQKKTK
jgi:hypothetical protein